MVLYSEPKNERKKNVKIITLKERRATETYQVDVVSTCHPATEFLIRVNKYILQQHDLLLPLAALLEKVPWGLSYYHLHPSSLINTLGKLLSVGASLPSSGSESHFDRGAGRGGAGRGRAAEPRK